MTGGPEKTTKISGEKMRELADYIKANIPGCGFALIAFEVEEIANANYISNVQDEFMVQTLERQLNSLKNKTTFLTPEDKAVTD
ncbi:hypothetical protein [Mucilaginibacter jinjuensis]|uniref:Tautomerase-like protein n=1 Tax=Mucilaginibacter jinjuensis TaxID=1176721 RepID=A0ABY7T344_9SPHI|nr:hypothetical protein [Mucilaginibacter jinjuensis]WCT10719.1 hypothetical protein PQO05_18440 [Mucilaginibacter jinjuensis]